jgi:hypothetical protein
MIHLIAQSLLFLACLAAWVWRRPLVHFVTVECSHCEGWIRRDEMAREAQAVLAVMCERRWG